MCIRDRLSTFGRDGAGDQQRRIRTIRPKRASSWNMIRTVRVPTASGVSRAAKSSGSFFSRPLESADRSWDDACPAPPCATHGAPETGRRPKLPPSAPSVAPAPPESATPPTIHPTALVLPKAAGTPVLLLRSSACVAFRPNPGGYRRRCRAAAGTRTGAAARLLVQHLTLAPSALARRSTPLGATPPRLAGAPGCPGFAAQPACLLYTSPSPRDRTRSRMP